jgi:NhaP-type Na+/H+ or K+/H+ antiporter
MLGGMRGALSIALAASIATSTLVTATYVNDINVMVLSVALVSITLQAGVLTNYAKKVFPQDQEREHEKLTIRLAKARSAIELLQKMYEEGKISESEFAEELEKDKDELTEVLSEINLKVNVASVAKTRASELYFSVRNLRNSNVINILRRHSISGSVEEAVEGAEATPIKSDAAKEQDGK